MRIALIVGLTLAACGGSSKPAATTPTSSDGEDRAEVSEGDDLVAPERMDEIKTLLDRKRTAAARCLADAINRGDAPKNASGHIAVGFTIGTGGRATGAKVLESSVDNDGVERCVIEKIESIEFGSLPKPLEWSYVFAFESM